MQGQDAVYSWINKRGPKMDRYVWMTEEEFETLKAIREGKAQVVSFQKDRHNAEPPKVGDIDQDDCKIIEIDSFGDYLVSSPLDSEEVEIALKNGAKRVRI